METDRNTPPILVIGMHRSGTTVVSEVMEKMGCFMGWRKPHHHEPAFINSLNDWILRQSGASWDNPLAIRFLLEDPEIRQLVARYVQLQLRSPRAASYWGAHYFQYFALGAHPKAWGWKDPRNTFTLPIWLDLYPDARVVHVVRHGIDVAQSLVVRHEEIFREKKAIFERYRLIYMLRAKSTGFTDTLPASTLTGAFALWEQYVDQARDYARRLGSRALEIRYEQFLATPMEELSRLSEFCKLETSGAKLEALKATLRPTRGLAYRSSAALRAAAPGFRASLEARGYSV